MSLPAHDSPAAFPTEAPVSAQARLDAAATALSRAACPFFLFAACLTLLLFLSWNMLLPRFAKVEVSGKDWNAEELASHRSLLTASILQSERRRRSSVLSVDDDQYQALKAARTEPLSLERVTAEIEAQAALAAGSDAKILLQSVEYDIAQQSVVATGDVRGVGPRSMTVLASFTEILAKSALIESLDPPRFERRDDAGIGPHSPFIITLRLR